MSHLAEKPVPVDRDPIVVVGMGIALPGVWSPEEFWSLLCERRSVFGDPPPNRWTREHFASDARAADKSYQNRMGFIADPPPSQSATLDCTMDYVGQWLRHSLIQALDDRHLSSADAVCLCVGVGADNSQHLEDSSVAAVARELLNETVSSPFPRTDGPARYLPRQIVAEAMADILPETTRVRLVDTACSSALYALDLTVRELRSGRADVGVCAGTYAVTPATVVHFAQIGALSRSGVVRALDRDADGVLFSDGAAALVLKRLSKASADGDRILGVIAGIGLSCDGRGKAVYAPSSAGQEVAIRRALADAEIEPGDIELIVGHATGTPTGDATEVAGLARVYRGERPIWLTSNKSQVGHAAWVSGLVSVVHLLSAMGNGAIPPQYPFAEVPESTRAQTDVLVVPKHAVAWPPSARPRTGAVSSFGFGGTNAHVIIQEYRPGRTPMPAARRRSDRLVIVGWSGHLPGSTGNADVASWARCESGPVAHSFGDSYPAPAFEQLRLPPRVVRHTDRTQLMLVECVHRLDLQVREFCATRHLTTGVIVGHTGMTRASLESRVRTHADRLVARLSSASAVDRARALERLRAWAGPFEAGFTEDTYTGVTTCIIASRLANYFDFRGLNILVDDGADSLLTAFDVAARYLEFGDLDVALVAAASGNSLESRLTSPEAEPSAEIGEGAFLFALTTATLARNAGLPILAELAAISPGAEAA